MTGWRKALLVCGFLTASLAAVDVHATVIVYSFSGTLTSSLGTLNAGDAFSGTYTVDTSVAAASGSTSSQSVFNNLLGATLTIGSFTATIGPGTGLAEIQQDNNVFNGIDTADRYALVGRNPVGSSQIGGQDISLFGFRLDDPTQTAISDALVLLTNPSLSLFSGQTFLIFFGSPTSPDFQVVTGNLSGFSTQQSVPEPATLVLALTALLMLGAMRKRFGTARRMQARRSAG